MWKFGHLAAVGDYSSCWQCNCLKLAVMSSCMAIEKMLSSCFDVNFPNLRPLTNKVYEVCTVCVLCLVVARCSEATLEMKEAKCFIMHYERWCITSFFRLCIYISLFTLCAKMEKTWLELLAWTSPCKIRLSPGLCLRAQCTICNRRLVMGMKAKMYSAWPLLSYFIWMYCLICACSKLKLIGKSKSSIRYNNGFKICHLYWDLPLGN